MIKRRIITIFLVISMIFSMSVMLFACKDKNNGGENDGENQGDNSNNTSGTQGGDNQTPDREYSVTLLDRKNNPIVTKSSVIVTVYEGTEKKSTKSVNSADGKATFDFKEGNYTFTLTFISPEDKFYYDSALCVMSEENPSVKLNLASIATKTEDLYNDSEASIIDGGSYYTELKAGEIAYFLYMPKERGRYKISVDTSAEAICGYYGSTAYIYENDISNEEDRENGSIYMDFRKYNVNSTQYLFGVKAETSGFGYFTIEKVSDLDYIPEEYDWTEYKKTTQITKFTYSGGNLVDFDITNGALSAVYNSNDGYYHLNSADGPIIYVNLTKSNQYTDAIQKISETQHLGRYVYDENGKFLYKVTYATMMAEYYEAVDEAEGIYPLTYDLGEAIMQMGEYLGWYTPAAAGDTHPFFGSVAFIPSIAWLFACCYSLG